MPQIFLTVTGRPCSPDSTLCDQVHKVNRILLTMTHGTRTNDQNRTARQNTLITEGAYRHETIQTVTRITNIHNQFKINTSDPIYHVRHYSVHSELKLNDKTSIRFDLNIHILAAHEFQAVDQMLDEEKNPKIASKIVIALY